MVQHALGQGGLGLFVKKPCLQGIHGGLPCVVGGEGRAPKHMGCVFLSRVTAGAAVMGLVATAQETFAHPALASAVFGQPPAFAKGLAGHGPTEFRPGNVVVH